MSASREFIEFVQELFAPLGGIAVRRMFGGAGVFSRGLMFALVHDDVLYLKADAETQKAFQARKCGPYFYDAGKGKQVALSYWQMPAELIDDAEEAVAWAKTALDVARIAKAAVPPPSRRASVAEGRRRLR